ncbi:MAG: hypothetical protein ACD_31C00006G0001 [uncultured bacterium]|nr:MAG: hypothetical protein ACD_31C00006G0001 [uncultured bacterium]
MLKKPGGFVSIPPPNKYPRIIAKSSLGVLISCRARIKDQIVNAASIESTKAILSKNTMYGVIATKNAPHNPTFKLKNLHPNTKAPKSEVKPESTDRILPANNGSSKILNIGINTHI